MAKIRVLQVHEEFYRDEIQDYKLADFEGEKRETTLLAIYGYRVDKEVSPHITVREVLSRIAPPTDYIWYKLKHGGLCLYKYSRHAD